MSGCGSIKAGFVSDAVLLFEFFVGAERDHVGVALLIVADAAPVELGQAVAEWPEKIVFAVIGEIGGEVAARWSFLHFVAIGIFARFVSVDGGSLCSFQRFIVGSVAAKIAGVGVKTGGAHIRDKKRCLLVDPPCVAAGNLGEDAGDGACCCCHDGNLLFCGFGL